MASLILLLHGDALRAISKVLQRHCEGLQQASRLARQRGIISNKLAKKLCQLDIAFNLVRHITEPSARGMMQEIEQQLENNLHMKPDNMDNGEGQDIEYGEETIRVLTDRAEQGVVKPGEEACFQPTRTTSGPCAGKVFTVETLHVDTDYDVLDELSFQPERPIDAPMRMPMSGTYGAKSVGDVLAGRAEQGAAEPGEEEDFFQPTHTGPCTGKAATVEPCSGDVVVHKRNTTFGQTRGYDLQIQVQDIPKEIMGVYSKTDGVQRRAKQFFPWKAFAAFRQACRKQKLERICAEHDASEVMMLRLVGQEKS